MSDENNMRAGLQQTLRAQNTKALGAAIDSALNGGKETARKTFFALITFPVLSGPSEADYITNSLPEDLVTVLRKLLDKLEGKNGTGQAQTGK